MSDEPKDPVVEDFCVTVDKFVRGVLNMATATALRNPRLAGVFDEYTVEVRDDLPEPVPKKPKKKYPKKPAPVRTGPPAKRVGPMYGSAATVAKKRAAARKSG